MSRKLVERLSLGTVQFGMKYGIANKGERVSRAEAFGILKNAYDVGLDTLDTAYSYGESEGAIGEFISETGSDFSIISKTPGNSEAVTDIESHLIKTLKKLKKDRIHGYLVHNFKDIVSSKDMVMKCLDSLKKRGLVEKTGISLYRPEELSYILDNELSFDIIQIPYNILDRRFEEYFDDLKSKEMDIHIRSVFLQGLFFLGMDKISTDFKPAESTLKELYAISEKENIPISSICLCFVLLNPLVSKAIIGVDSVYQLKDNLASLDDMDKVMSIYVQLKPLKLYSEEVVIPSNWKR